MTSPTDWIQIHAADEATPLSNLDARLNPGRHRFGLHLVDDAASKPVRIPVIVLKGERPGPVVGITAAVHGNELNGIFTIHRLFRRIQVADLRGTVVGVTIANLPGYLRHQRTYADGNDLNRIMPGRADGNEAQLYAHRLRERVLNHFDVLLDLHTASFGRINSLYIRADMRDQATADLARAVGAEIIVHNEGADGTVRDAVASRGVPAITIEIGDPQVLDREKVRDTRIGIREILEHLEMVPPDERVAERSAVECRRSYWLYTDTGGLLDVKVDLAHRVTKGDVIATLVDPWGQQLRTYRAPEDGIIVGCSTNPVARGGSRIVHLGIVGSPE